MLPSETNDEETKLAIAEAAVDKFFCDVELFFEHGHWWCRFDDEGGETERTFSVVDCETIAGAHCFDFEQL